MLMDSRSRTVLRGKAFRKDGHFENDELRKAAEQQLFHALSNAGGPEARLNVGKVLFKQMQQAGSVADVTDVHRLPRGAKENAARACICSRQHGERQHRGPHRRDLCEELAPVHGER